MTDQVLSVIEPFVRRGLFSSVEQAVTELACDYVLRQIEHYQEISARLQAKYGMIYEEFQSYLKSRAVTLATNPNPTVNQAIMAEEEDALEWKMACEMLQSWLGLRAETKA